MCTIDGDPEYFGQAVGDVIGGGAAEQSLIALGDAGKRQGSVLLRTNLVARMDRLMDLPCDGGIMKFTSSN